MANAKARFNPETKPRLVKMVENYTDLKTAFIEIEKENNSFNKFYKPSYFAEHLNDDAKFNKYIHLLEQEQKRIDRIFN